MSLDLTKLETKLDKALSIETTETLTKFLNDKRMKNETKQTAVEWLLEQIQQKLYIRDNVIQQAKEMEKEQMRLIYNGILQNVGTIIKQSDLPTFDKYYNETYGGNK